VLRRVLGFGLARHDDLKGEKVSAQGAVFYRGLDIQLSFIAALPSSISPVVCGVSHAGYLDPVGYGGICGRACRMQDGHGDPPSRQREREEKRTSHATLRSRWAHYRCPGELSVEIGLIEGSICRMSFPDNF
jgi:hypothetical protein